MEIFQIITWRFETDEDDDLIKTIKSIKHHFVEARFSDIFLSALSISFEKYFASKGSSIPKYMTAVVPARIAAEGNFNSLLYILHYYYFYNIHTYIFSGPTFKLQNKFSVALQTLPINTDPNTKNQCARFYNKILEVKKFSDILRNSSDYFVRYFKILFEE